MMRVIKGQSVATEDVEKVNQVVCESWFMISELSSLSQISRSAL